MRKIIVDREEQILTATFLPYLHGTHDRERRPKATHHSISTQGEKDQSFTPM